MRIILQRVKKSSVSVNGAVVGSIGLGVLLLVGVEPLDGQQQVDAAVRKLKGLRIFEDQKGHMNLGPRDVGAAFLVVSQFTLIASLRKGRRPSFVGAAQPELAEPLVTELAKGLRMEGFEVAEGRFGAMMEVDLVNDGPVTLIMDIDENGRFR